MNKRRNPRPDTRCAVRIDPDAIAAAQRSRRDANATAPYQPPILKGRILR